MSLHKEVLQEGHGGRNSILPLARLVPVEVNPDILEFQLSTAYSRPAKKCIYLQKALLPDSRSNQRRISSCVK
ncbi:hypothetical protein GWI33_014039 [Rhynchophorus ferrugineus]|uniref:Uncharacterized protein n=1 Tax=Rhynchophorus ferrugineus TaxID=354439 RepID=A0A834I5B1_RHYFE|nr:hypothetical protein GWI33_014039 [Rhynchophorus ferrugineus]